MIRRYLYLGALFIVLSHVVIATYYDELSSLEKRSVDDGLVLYDLVPVNDAQGLKINSIYVVTSSPFSEDARFLTIFNKLHVNTKDDVIRQAIFQKGGEIFDEALVRDSELYLRVLGLVRSLAVIVPVKSKVLARDGEVDLLVATRDILSLRPSFNFKGSVNTLTNFMLTLGEHNFLGYNKSISGIYEYQQSGHIFSARYFDPMLFKSRFELTLRPSIIFSRHNLKFDGFLSDLRLERPLDFETDRFGYGIDLSYGSRPIIDFNGSKVRKFGIPSVNGSEAFDKKYRWRYGRNSLFGRVSFGRTYKNEIFFGYSLNIKRPSIPKEFNLDKEQQAYFTKHVLPRNELESFITVGYSYFHNEFLTLYDYDNFKLQEVKRIGPSVSVANDFSAEPILFSDHNFLRPELKLSYTQTLTKDSFLQGFLSTSNRFDGAFNDNVYKYGLSIVSPKIFDFGRLVVEGRLSLLYNNRDNQKFSLGSDSGVRGVGSRYYSGEKGFRGNVEFRSAPLDLWIFHAGLVVFYDVGAAFDKWHEANATHALGLGFRFLTPQLSSLPFRFDLAFPIYGKGRHDHVIVPSFGTGQAF